LKYYTGWLFLLIFVGGSYQDAYGQEDDASLLTRKMYLERLLSFFEEDDGVNNNPRAIRVSPLDPDWMSWLQRTGELPPDFSKMPSYWMPPDPLVIGHDSSKTIVGNIEQWQQQRSHL